MGKISTHTAATIYDVAKLAGVNASTVSRALGKPGRVSAKTLKLVKDAAAELNYTVNHLARGLLTGRTGMVGLIVADITNPSYFDIIRGAQSAAAAVALTLCYNDLLAIGLMQELQAAAVKIPDEFSVVGFDNIFGSDFTTPALTTISSHFSDCGAAALGLLLAALPVARPGPVTARPAGHPGLRTSLVLRGSSGRLLAPAK